MKTVIAYLFLFFLGMFCGIVIKSMPTSQFPVLNITSDPVPHEMVPEKILADINMYRAKRNMLPMKWDKQLCPFAAIRISEIQTDWSHDKFYIHAKEPFCPTCQKYGENLARGFYDEQKAVDAWINSPTHLPQLESPWQNACIKEQNGYAVLTVSY